MEENSQGEAHCYKNVDYNTDLSYIDEKVQNVLGHHLKDFEGEVSVENLGAKFGGYGSFLPTYERLCPKSPQRDSTATKSLNMLSTEVCRKIQVFLLGICYETFIYTAENLLLIYHTGSFPKFKAYLKRPPFCEAWYYYFWCRTKIVNCSPDCALTPSDKI